MNFADLFDVKISSTLWKDLKLDTSLMDQAMSRRTFAVLYDHFFKPFDRAIDFEGNLM